MKTTLALLSALRLAPLAVHSADNNLSELLDQQWVALGANGKLEYQTTPKGDHQTLYQLANTLIIYIAEVCRIIR